VFLVTIGARVLRILDSVEPRISDIRPRSFSPDEETHGTTPSEVCSNLGVSLTRVLKYAKVPIPGGVQIIDPSARTGFDFYREGATKDDRDRVLGWILSTILTKEVDRTQYGTFTVGSVATLSARQPEMVALNIRLVEVESEERPVIKPDGWNHVISVVRVNGVWYVADNEVGILMPIRTTTGGQFTPEILAQLESPHEVFFESRYIRTPGTGVRDEYPTAQYFLRDLMGEVVASTDRMPMLARDPSPGVRPLIGGKIMREMYGIEVPGDAIILPEVRTALYWKSTSRSSPPPDTSTSLMGMFGSTAAGAGGPVEFGGKRKTKKKKSKKRKTNRVNRGGRVRLSSPK